MSTVKFSEQDKLKELQSRIFLETKITLSQQEILELGVDIVLENLDLIINKISSASRILSEEEISRIMQIPSDWGEGSEDSSSTVDSIYE